MKILVADDKPAILDVLQQILEMEGYVVVTTTDGPKVLYLLHAEQPDLLLLDVWLPGCSPLGLNWLSYCARLRLPSHVAIDLVCLAAGR